MDFQKNFNKSENNFGFKLEKYTSQECRFHALYFIDYETGALLVSNRYTDSLNFLKDDLICSFLNAINLFINEVNEGANEELQEINFKGTRILYEREGRLLAIAITKKTNLQIERGGNSFFKVYNSEEFDEIGITSLGSCGSGNIGFINNETYAFETKINELINEYGEFGSENYEVLKEELKVPSRNDFGFSFIDNEETETIVGDKEVTTSVYARKIPIYYVDDNANVLLGFINIRVW